LSRLDKVSAWRQGYEFQDRGLLAAVVSLGFAQVASAADMPVKARPMTPVPVAFSWTGCYIGVNAGGLWGTKD
jgi:outer membrane immunogenic protein